MANLKISFLIILATLIFSGVGSAEALSNVTGTIKNKHGEAVPYTILYVKGQNGYSKRIWADSNGQFTLTGLEDSQYRITPRLLGYSFKPSFVTVSGSDVNIVITSSRSRWDGALNWSIKDSTPPGIPQNLTVEAISKSSITLNWDVPQDNISPSGFFVYNGSDALIWAGERSYHREIELSEGTQYCYKVSAFDGSGNVSATSGQACTNTFTSGWSAINSVGAPSARSGHSSVWTGSEKIVWGGYSGGSNYLDNGGIYSLASVSWTLISNTGAPPEMSWHDAFWTGSKMLLWGGQGTPLYQSFLNTGAIYDPSTGSWTFTSTSGAPTARKNYTATWTGSKLLIWGGNIGGNDYVNTGGVYDFATDSWSAINTTGAPSIRANHTAVWTGSKMIVWGGSSGSRHNTGGIYDPLADSWSAINTTGAPTARYIHSAIWTGSKMIVWGGAVEFPNSLNTGGIYDPSNDSWTAMSTVNAPTERIAHTALWMGSRMIIWAGIVWELATSSLSTGGIYDIATDTWTDTSLVNVPLGVDGYSAAWTGKRMIVWAGGKADHSNRVNTGGTYLP
jgi:hypothetical protein